MLMRFLADKLELLSLSFQNKLLNSLIQNTTETGNSIHQ